MTRIFLASSKELEPDRRAFEQEIHRRNQVWGRRGYEFQITVWEDFDDSMSPARKQDDYNTAIMQADLFVLLVGTKVGKYSREEFEFAWDCFSRTCRSGNWRAARKPRIYTYFKGMPEHGEPDPGPEYESVRHFLQRLSELGHWPNKYDDVSQLLHHFGTQLEKLWADKLIEPASPSAETDPGERAEQMSQAQQTAKVKGNEGFVVTGGVNVRSAGGAVVLGAVKVGAGFTGRDSIVGSPAAGRAKKKMS
jgi:hypothetical protein